MFNSFKNLEDITQCQSSGICAIDPSISILDELIMNEIRQIAFYLVKTYELNLINPDLTNKTIKALCMNFLNSNFKESDYLELYRNLIKDKKYMKTSYHEFCKQTGTSCQLLDVVSNLGSPKTILNAINQNSGFLRTNKTSMKENLKLLELIPFLVKSASINIEKIKAFEPEFNDFDFEVLRFFSLTNFPSTRREKLLRRINEFLEVANKIQRKLSEVLRKNYGEQTTVKVPLNAVSGNSILVSGDNLKELEMLLDATKGKDINVYTHNTLLLAWSYPKFQKSENLKGHWGCGNLLYDFANFKGPVFLTKNINQRIDSIYRGLLYSSDVMTPKGVGKIINHDFAPLISAAYAMEGFLEPEEPRSIIINQDKSEINEMMLSAEKEIFVLIGDVALKRISKMFGNKKMLKLNSPFEVDLLFYILDHAKGRKITVNLFFAKCTMQTINFALTLTKENIGQICLFKCPKYYLNPYVSDCLREEFNVRLVD